MVNLDLVNASTGKRVGAKLIDMALTALVQAVPVSIGSLMLTGLSGNRYPTAADERTLMAALIWMGVGSVLGLALWIFCWGWEARAGKTPGQAMLGLRTSDLEGFAPGWGKVFVRSLIFGLVCLIPLAGVVLALISNVFDANGKRQGWHDKAAKTYVFDVRAGRDPLTTGGINGPASFAPRPDLPPVREVASPVAAPSRPGYHAASAVSPEQQSAEQQSAEQQLAGQQPLISHAPISHAPSQPPISQPWPSHQGPVSPPPVSQPWPSHQGPVSQPLLPQSPAPTHSLPITAPFPHELHGDDFPGDLDEAFGQTRFAPSGHAQDAQPQQGAQGHDVLLSFSDGRRLVLRGPVLVGRNPAAYADETVQELLSVQDPGKSVSKTHLAVWSDRGRVWVQDRKSTNGTRVVRSDGGDAPAPAGQPVEVDAGDVVHFGDHFFSIGRGRA